MFCAGKKLEVGRVIVELITVNMVYYFVYTYNSSEPPSNDKSVLKYMTLHTSHSN